MSILDILLRFQDEFILGLKTTIQLSLIIWFFGLTLGGLLGTAAARWKLIIGIPLQVSSFVLAGIPVLVFLFWMHYPMQTYLGIIVDPFITAAVTLSIVNVLLVSELFRNALKDFPSQYVNSARICGLNSFTIASRIQAPIIIRQILPQLLVVQITMLQSTLFASLISVDEVFRIAQRINSQIYQPVEIYTALAALFLVICLPLHAFARWFKSKYTRNLSEQ